MAFTDIETLFGAFSSIFGANANLFYLLGLLLTLLLFSISISLGIGFEATIVVICSAAFVFANVGLLPPYTMLLMLIGGTIVVKNIVGYIMEVRA